MFGSQTGWDLREVARAYDEFVAAGYIVTFASPKGGKAPLDPMTVNDASEDAICMAFVAENAPTNALMAQTTSLADIQDTSAYDAVYFVGGYGTMCDFPDNVDVQRIVRAMWEENKVVSAVGHGVSALVNVALSDGSLLVKGKKVTSFTDKEEAVHQMHGEVIPFMCEDKLKEQGASWTPGEVDQLHVVKAGRLITGQNSVSAKLTAETVIGCIKGHWHILIVIAPTGSKWCLPEIAHAYDQFQAANCLVTFVSEKVVCIVAFTCASAMLIAHEKTFEH